VKSSHKEAEMKDPKVTEIQSLAMFRECRPKDVLWIAGVADTVDIPAGRTIVQDGQTVREFVVLVRGSASAGNGSVTLTPGAYFGEMGLIDGKPHAHTVRTSAPTRLLVFSAGAFRGMLTRIPSVGRQLLAGMVSELRETAQEPRRLRAVS
jgi:CRP/FNR family cyclic AMP-dependent transcriptional regulator